MFVLDASVLAKSFLDEGRSEDLRAWLDGALTKGTALFAPHLAYSELGRIIQKECRDLSLEQAKELHRTVFLGITVLPLDTTQQGVWDVSAGVSYYDAEYLDACLARRATLVSADDAQVQAASRLGVKFLSFTPAGKKPAQAA